MASVAQENVAQESGRSSDNCPSGLIFLRHQEDPLKALRRTPCVGICSTTYGDLVCRGCKRFSHEIVEWNGFDDSQREVVWARLYRLREGATGCYLRVASAERLLEAARELSVPDPESLSELCLAYEVLRRSVGKGKNLTELGLDAVLEPATITGVLQPIEQELYERAVAQYEHSFHIPVS